MVWIFKNKKVTSENPINRGSATGKMISLGKKKKAFLVALFLVSIFFGLGGYGYANAEGFNFVTDSFALVIKTVLIFVLNGMGWLFAIATTLFAWVVEPANISGSNGVLNKQVVKDVWIMVRDLLNMAFILVLLFAAFCTIFQIDKWNLKKVWLNILINALLVNFSFPIARFFIDVSNVAFYYLLNSLFASSGTAPGSITGTGIFAMFAGSTGVGNTLVPTDFTTFDITYIIAMIVILFIMGMTLCIVAALFLVRLVALTMLVMFSPVGFVGYIFPSTASYADDWWKKLFSYAFFAPIMIFFMAIALRVTEAIGAENMRSFKAIANANSPANQSSWIASVAFLFIPIIILWMGIGVAKSMGVAGADAVVGAAKSGGKSLAMFGAGNWAKKNYDGYVGARKARQDEIKKKSLGADFGKLANNAADRAHSMTGVLGAKDAQKRYDKRKDADNKDDIKSGVEEQENKSMPDLKREISESTARRDRGETLTPEQKKQDAINAKMALSRPKYDGEMEDEFKAGMADVSSLTDDQRSAGGYAELHSKRIGHASAESARQILDAEVAAMVAPPDTASPEQQAAHANKMAEKAAARVKLKEAEDKAKKAVESEEKKVLQKKKSDHLDVLRGRVEEYQELGKIKPETPTPTATPATP